MINLVSDTIDNDDIDQLIDWLKAYPFLTKGKRTEEYEDKWAKYIGKKYGVFVNSGSSANLLMIYSLIASGKLSPGDKVIVPTLSWATDMAPIVQFGLTPILCDCNLEDLSINLNSFEHLCKRHQPKAVMLVSVLGLVPQMVEVRAICDRQNVILLEDVCESLGAQDNGEKLGSSGLMSSFSTYFGHHISTIEGGMVCTDDKEIYNVLKSLRSHGWDRDLDPDVRQRLRNKFNIDDFSGLYTFYYPGFNLRSTDLQAVIGLGQLDKLSDIVKKRNSNFRIYYNLLNTEWKPSIRENQYVSNFAYPVIDYNKQEMVKALQAKDIAVRPLICGSMNEQPAYKAYAQPLQLFPNAKRINDYGFYIPNHPGLSEDDITLICTTINDNI